MDGVELEILWSNLIGIVSERAKSLQRIAFSPVVRDCLLYTSPSPRD